MHKAIVGVAALSLTLLGLWTTGTAAQAASPRPRQQIVVPAYFNDPASWSAVDSGAPTAAMAIANVSNGPGDTVSSTWQTLISTAHQGGVKVLGYVATGYLGAYGAVTTGGASSTSAWLAQAESDVDQWYALYGSDNIGGIYFDEALSTCGTNNANAKLYAQLSRYVKNNHPGAVTVISPGGDVPKCYVHAADIIVRFEGTYASYQTFVPNAWESGYAPGKFMEIVHDTPAGSLSGVIRQSRADGTGHIYVTDQAYSALPSYWNTEVSSVHRHH